MTSLIERYPRENLRTNISGLLNVVSTYIRWRKLEQLKGSQIVENYGEQIRQGLSLSSPNATPVLVCARNECNDLPRLLLALSRQNVHVIVVDNASIDGTGDIAQSLGAEVIIEPKPGLSYALASGFNHLQEKFFDHNNKLLLLTDADTYPVAGWSESMKQATQTILAKKPGILTAPVVGAGNGIMQDAFRTSSALAKDIYYDIHHYINARGPNSAILLDEEGNIINALAHHMDMEVFIGQDQMVQDTVVETGGIARYNWSPNAVVIMRGDRYGSINDIIRTFLNPDRIKLYADYPRPNGSVKEYYSRTRLKIGKY